MAEVFFKDLQIRKPHFYLSAGGASDIACISRILIRFENLCREENPRAVIVFGDVNSTIACALTASRLRIPLAHVEAGLRSFDRSMPEETNRIATDHLSDLLFTSCADADANLGNEGISRKKIFRVGNIMIDTLLRQKKAFLSDETFKRMGLGNRRYALLTLHRPENVDSYDKLKGILSAVRALSRHLPVLFPIHPRTQERIREYGLNKFLRAGRPGRPKNITGSVNLLPPLRYIEFLNLMHNSLLVLTDSGGIQEETTTLRVPCLTLRENTERPITLTEGTNTLVGSEKRMIVKESMRILEGPFRKGKVPGLWDGKTSERIVRVLNRRL